jgi:hypothetical protein
MIGGSTSILSFVGLRLWSERHGPLCMGRSAGRIAAAQRAQLAASAEERNRPPNNHDRCTHSRIRPAALSAASRRFKKDRPRPSCKRRPSSPSGEQRRPRRPYLLVGDPGCFHARASSWPLIRTGVRPAPATAAARRARIVTTDMPQPQVVRHPPACSPLQASPRSRPEVDDRLRAGSVIQKGVVSPV